MKKLTDEQRSEALRLRRAGVSFREIGKHIGVSHVTARRVCGALDDDEAPTSPDASPAPAPIPPDAPALAEEPAPEIDALDFARTSLLESQRIARESRAAGNFAAAQKASRDAAAYLAILARLERQAGEDRDVVKIPAAELEAARRSVHERLEALAAHEVRCFDCGRRMRATLAGLSSEAQERIFDNGGGQ